MRKKRQLTSAHPATHHFITMLFRTTLLVALAMYASADLSTMTLVDVKDTALAMGVGFYSGTDGVFPASNGGSVGVLATHDDETVEFEAAAVGGMPMAAGGSKTSGIAMGGGMGGAAMSTNGGRWESLSFPNPLFITQDIKHNAANDIWSVTGLFFGKQRPSLYGSMATSTDSGATWTIPDLPLDTFYDNQDVRYSAAPSVDVMYINSGMWAVDDGPSEETPALRGVKRHKVSNRVSVDTNGKLSVNSKAPAVSDPLSAWAQVAKTTDGGKTWTLVHGGAGYYPNDIDCFDEDNCAMAVEGTNINGVAFGRIMITSDGGANWAMGDMASASMMGVKMVSKTEVWGAGATENMVGALFQTTDGGATWDSASTEPSDLVALITSIDFDGNGDAWGTGMKRTQISCVIHGQMQR